jgi:hypothetical protein
MKILALEHELPGASSETFQGIAKEEAHNVWELHQAGLVRDRYFRADRNTAVLDLECHSGKGAASLLASLLYGAQGRIDYELIPLKAYSGFARLFASPGSREDRL